MEVLSLFNYKATMIGPWINAGHHCTIVDPKLARGCTTGDSLTKIHADMLMYEPTRELDFIMAFPLSPTNDDLNELSLAIKIFEHTRHICEDLYEVPYLIESPLGILASYWRNPDCIIDFDIKSTDEDIFSSLDAECTNVGSSYLWVGGGFKLPKHPCLRPADEFIKSCDSSLREQVPSGFAKAVYKENK